MLFFFCFFTPLLSCACWAMIIVFPLLQIHAWIVRLPNLTTQPVLINMKLLEHGGAHIRFAS